MLPIKNIDFKPLRRGKTGHLLKDYHDGAGPGIEMGDETFAQRLATAHGNPIIAEEASRPPYSDAIDHTMVAGVHPV